jgi:hypothetical protein
VSSTTANASALTVAMSSVRMRSRDRPDFDQADTDFLRLCGIGVQPDVDRLAIAFQMRYLTCLLLPTIATSLPAHLAGRQSCPGGFSPDTYDGSLNTSFSIVSLNKGDESANVLPSGARISNFIHTRPDLLASRILHSRPAWRAARQLSPVA